MTMAPEPTTTIRLREPEDLLALIPHQTGHPPREASVVFLPATGGHAVCLGLDTPGEDRDVDVLAEELGDVLRTVPHCGEAVVVVYSDHEHGPQLTVTVPALERWTAVAQRLGLTLLRTLVVGPAHWWDAEAPYLPRPVRLIADSAVNAQLVAMGSGAEPGSLCRDSLDRARWRERGIRVFGADEGPHTAGSAVPVREAPDREASGQEAADREASGQGTADRETPDRKELGGGGTGPAARPPGDLDRARSRLRLWDRAVSRVGAQREDWVDTVLRLPDHELRELVAGLEDHATRDALLYLWLTGSLERAQAALEGLHVALRHLSGEAGRGTEPATDVVDEALRCVVTVSGEWDGPPHWDTLDGAHRVLQVLAAVLRGALPAAEHPVPPAGRGSEEPEPGPAPQPRSAQERLVTVTAVLAQIEQYRGRSHTAARMLRDLDRELAGAGDGPRRRRVRGRSALGDVQRRLSTVVAPWWCADRRTSWPGRHTWARSSPAPA